MTFKKVSKDYSTRHFLTRSKKWRCLFKTVRMLSLVNYSDHFWLHQKCYRLRHQWIHNYCILTGKSRGVVGLFNLTRNQYKLYVTQGEIFTQKKISW